MSGYACAYPRLNMALPLSTKTSNIFINNHSFQSMSSKNQTTWRGNRRIQNILNHRAILERMKVVLVAILNKGYTSLVHVILFFFFFFYASLFFLFFFMIHVNEKIFLFEELPPTNHKMGLEFELVT